MKLKEKIEFIALEYITNDGSHFYSDTPKEVRDLIKAIPHPEYHQPGETNQMLSIWHLVDCFNYMMIPDYYKDHPDWKGAKLKRIQKTCQTLKIKIEALNLQ